MSLYKRFALRGLLTGAIIAAVVAVGAIVLSAKKTEASTARDCETNSVLWGGALTTQELISRYDHGGLDNGSTHCGNGGHGYSDVPAIYNFFGITSSDIHNLPSHVVLGQVRKDGTVWIGNQQIGEQALSAGRTDFPGSLSVPGTGAFWRAPATSFASPVLDALIGFKNGVPTWAVLTSCGNPVMFEHPKLAISKQVKDPKTGTYGKNATFSNGDTIHYLLTVTNTGHFTASDVKVADLLPAGQNYVKGSTKVNGKSVADGLIGFKGIDIGLLAAGASAKVTFDATASVAATKCGLNDMTNTAAASATQVNPVSDTAGSKVNVTCVSQCVALTASADEVEIGQKLTLTANAIAKGVSITSYTFKVDGKVSKVVQTSANKTTFDFVSNKVGEHTVSVSVKFSNGKVDGDKGACVKTVTVKAKPAILRCDSLTADKDLVKPNEPIVFTAKGHAENASITSYNFKVNGVSQQNTKSNIFKFSTTKEGTYTVQVVVHSKDAFATSQACVKKVDVQSKPKPIFRCEAMTVDHDSVNVGSTVTAKVKFVAKNGAAFKQATFSFGDETTAADKTLSNKLEGNDTVVATHTYNKVGNWPVTVQLDFVVNGKLVRVNDPDCVKQVAVSAVPPTTTTLPNTGPEDIAGIFVATSVAGAVAHKLWYRRYAR